MELKIFPGENGEKPYWVNPENGFEWYIDKSTTEWCSRYLNDLKELRAVVFYVCENKNGKIEPLERILIDRDTNEVIAHDTSLEGIATKIDLIRFLRSQE